MLLLVMENVCHREKHNGTAGLLVWEMMGGLSTCFSLFRMFWGWVGVRGGWQIKYIRCEYAILGKWIVVHIGRGNTLAVKWKRFQKAWEVLRWKVQACRLFWKTVSVPTWCFLHWGVNSGILKKLCHVESVFRRRALD